MIEINAADIDWQEKMLPWTLAGLINNTDLIMKGVHLYVVCEDDLRDRIRTALKRFDLPPGTIIVRDEDNKPLIVFGKYGYRYDSVCMLDVNYWAFRGIGKSQGADIKLPLGHVLRHTYNWAVADYSFEPTNDIHLKDTWVRMSEPLPVSYDFQKDKEKIREYLVDASARAKWLHDANTAVYGEDYRSRTKTSPPTSSMKSKRTGIIDASILHYSAREVNTYFAEWAAEWQHLGTEALVALYLLKTEQHAHNLGDSVMIEPNYVREAYPRLCNMQFADVQAFKSGTKELLGAQLNITMN